jgi:serine/threonine protein kinase
VTSASATKRPTALSTGEVLDGKYRILREIGRGAMGVVYEALHVALERRVAVKTLLEDISADAQVGARFEREARAASAVGHPNIVDVFDLGRTSDGLLFMAMEYLDGESLASILSRTPKLPIPLAIHLMNQVLGGLAAAHKHGIVHRDLKPDNIFVLRSEERPNFVKIVDFGISKILAPPQGANPSVTAKVAGTMVGSVLGTPLYMSPEQAIGQVASIDHRSDIYSAGVVLYEMLCGRTPYLGASYTQLFASLLEGNYPPPRSLAPEIPPNLEAAVVRALDRDMNKRFPTAAAMRQAIGGGSADPTPAPMLMPASLGDPLRAPHAGEQASVGKSSIALLENPVPDRVGRRPSGRAGPGADPFAPPPEHDLAPDLADDLDRPLALRRQVRPVQEERPIELAQPARERPVSPAKGTVAPERILSSRARSRLLLALAVLTLAVAARIGYSVLRPEGQGRLSMRRGESQKVLLSVVPEQATVQVDHRPTTERDLALDSGGEHVLNAAAPGRITRRFSFAATPGLKLQVFLGHSLPLPSPTDPPPLPAELLADSPEQAREVGDIEAAFAKLDRYAECLALAGDASSNDKKTGARGRMRSEEHGLCERLASEAAAARPAMPELESAAEAYLAAVRGGQRLEQLARLGTTFRAEFLAARTTWQFEELARDKQEGAKAGWQMRRIALAAQSWLRALKAGPGAPLAATKLREYQEAFLDSAKNAGADLAVSGQADFVRASEELVALAAGREGRKPSEMAALDGCRRLFSAFNALVLP